MKLTQENVEATIEDLENMIFYYEHHGKLFADDATAQTLRDAVEQLQGLKYYAD